MRPPSVPVLCCINQALAVAAKLWFSNRIDSGSAAQNDDRPKCRMILCQLDERVFYEMVDPGCKVPIVRHANQDPNCHDNQETHASSLERAPANRSKDDQPHDPNWHCHRRRASLGDPPSTPKPSQRKDAHGKQACADDR